MRSVVWIVASFLAGLCAGAVLRPGVESGPGPSHRATDDDVVPTGPSSTATGRPSEGPEGGRGSARRGGGETNPESIPESGPSFGAPDNGTAGVRDPADRRDDLCARLVAVVKARGEGWERVAAELVNALVERRIDVSEQVVRSCQEAPSADVRTAALRLIPLSGGSVEALVEAALRDESAVVRANAVRLLGNLGRNPSSSGAEFGEDIVAALDDDASVVRQAARQALVHAGAAGVEAALRLFRDGCPESEWEELVRAIVRGGRLRELRELGVEPGVLRVAVWIVAESDSALIASLSDDMPPVLRDLGDETAGVDRYFARLLSDGRHAAVDGISRDTGVPWRVRAAAWEALLDHEDSRESTVRRARTAVLDASTQLDLRIHLLDELVRMASSSDPVRAQIRDDLVQLSASGNYWIRELASRGLE
jgi:HEAT repeat protein